MAKDSRSGSNSSDLRKQAEKSEAQLPDMPNIGDLSTEQVQQLIHELKVHQIELEIQNDELRRTEDELEASRDRYVDLYDFSPVGYLTLDKKGRIIRTNLTASRLLGIERGRLTQKSLSQFVSPSDNYALNVHVKHIFMRNSPQVSELRFIRGDSTSFTGLLQSVAIEDANDAVVECRSVITDITKQKLLEDNLYRELEINRAIAEMMAQLLSPAYKIGDVAKVVFEMAKTLTQSRHGYVNATDERTGNQISLTLSEMFENDCRMDGPLSIEFPVGPDGVYPGLWGHALNTRSSFYTNSPTEHIASRGLPEGHVPLKNFLAVPVIQDNELVGQIAVANSPGGYDEKDIEVVEKIARYYALGLLRKRYEETQSQLVSAIDQAAEAVVVIDTGGIVQYVNPAFEKITGYLKNEVKGRRPRFLDPEYNDPETVNNIWNVTTGGLVWSGSFRGIRKDGTSGDVRLSIAPVRDDTGVIRNLVAVFSDVSNEIKLQSQLLQSQKLEAVGTLAGGIAHDFNNILQVVLGYSEHLLDEKEIPTNFQAELMVIRDAALRGADLVKRMMLFSRKTETTLKPVNINQTVQEISKLLSRTVNKNVKIDILPSDDTPTIMADPNQVEQVIMNIALNARDAMPEGGKITLETTDVFLDSAFCDSHLGSSPGHFVLLRISDNGCGMTEDVLPHIFEPFFTTKAAGAGTGLGLSSVYGIVQNHKGFITCESRPGVGTTFSIYFPVDNSLRPDVEAIEILPRPGGDETILVVDDEEFIRSFEQEALQREGYKVITAENGLEALEIYRSEHKSISLTILDISMPGMDGLKCMRHMLEINSEARIILCSGLDHDLANVKLQGTGARAFIRKPSKKNFLLDKVREILDHD